MNTSEISIKDKHTSGSKFKSVFDKICEMFKFFGTLTIHVEKLTAIRLLRARNLHSEQ